MWCRVVTALCVVVGWAAQAERSAVERAALEKAVAAYRPGALADIDETLRLGNQFHEVWGLDGKTEAAMVALQESVETEALLAMIVLLRAKNPKLIYGSYSAPQDTTKQEIESADGLLGLRVVRQTELLVDDKPRLLSGIFSYYRNDDGSFRLREDLDTVRVRVEVEPFRPATAKRPARGFLGFSWNTSFAAKTLRVDATPVVDDAVVAAENRAGTRHSHAGMRKVGVTPCAFPSHCLVCHHARLRNFFDEHVPPADFLQASGPKRLLRQLLEAKVSDDALAKARKDLRAPNETFPAAPLLAAFEERWFAKRTKR